MIAGGYADVRQCKIKTYPMIALEPNDGSLDFLWMLQPYANVHVVGEESELPESPSAGIVIDLSLVKDRQAGFLRVLRPPKDEAVK